MAEITNPQAVRFCNEDARTIADALCTLRRTIPQFMLNVVRDFEANTGSNSAQDSIIDGAQIDGRPMVVKVNVGELKYVCEQIGIALNTDDRADIVNRWAVNGTPLY